MKLSNSIEMLNEDVCFQTKDNRRFRLRAAAIIIEDGCVLFATNDSEHYYYSIGGGVHLGETMENAVLREVYEETGIHYEIDRLAFIQENFFKRDDGMLKGLSCHEITFFFLMKSKGSQELNSNSVSHGFKEHMCWLPIDRLSEYEAYPMFFAEKLKNIPPYPQHILTIQK
ncbi:MAG: NUDIX hydrolase [Alphaproteobacteria bacterium]